MERTLNPVGGYVRAEAGPSEIKGLGPLGLPYVPTSGSQGAGTGPHFPPVSPGVSQAIQSTYPRQAAPAPVPTGASDYDRVDADDFWSGER